MYSPKTENKKIKKKKTKKVSIFQFQNEFWQDMLNPCFKH